MTIRCDNESAILIASDNSSKKRTRYLSRAFYFVNDFVRQHHVSLQWTSTHIQQADIMTKRLWPNKIIPALDNLQLKPVHFVKRVGGGGGVMKQGDTVYKLYKYIPTTRRILYIDYQHNT